MSVHPFTGGSHPTDVRITTRYSSRNWLDGVSGTVHEVGHALYEQGRNAAYNNLPVSRFQFMVAIYEVICVFFVNFLFGDVGVL